MEREMTHWNDDRLDELNGRIKEGFADVDKRADERLAGVDKRFAEVDRRFDKVDERFDKVDERFVRLEGEMKADFGKVDGHFVRLEGEMKEGFAELKAEIRQMGDRLEKRIDRVSNRLDRFIFTMVAAGVGLLVAAVNGGLS